MNASATVFIVDGAWEIRTALLGMLGTAGYPVRSFESAERFLHEQDEDTPGCLLLNVRLPGLSGLGLQRMLNSSPTARPIIFLTAQANIETSVKAMKAGAVDFLTKPIDRAVLFEAIDQGLKRDAKQRLARAIRHDIEQRFMKLTARERQVMVHIIRGRLNKLIAADLGIGEKTIKVHRGRVMLKMRAHSVPELIYLARWVGVSAQPILRVTEAAVDRGATVEKTNGSETSRKTTLAYRQESHSTEKIRGEILWSEPRLPVFQRAAMVPPALTVGVADGAFLNGKFYSLVAGGG